MEIESCVERAAEGPNAPLCPAKLRAGTIPDAAGGEGGHRAAKPDHVIHRGHFYRCMEEVPTLLYG